MNKKIKLINDKQEYYVISPVCLIGKSDLCDIVIKGNNSISRQHCQIEMIDDLLYISDLGSSNGTYLNGYKLDSNKRNLLNNNDIIKISDEPYYVSIEEDYSDYIIPNDIVKNSIVKVYGTHFQNEYKLINIGKSELTIGTYEDCKLRLSCEDGEQYWIRISKYDEGLYVVTYSENIELYYYDKKIYNNSLMLLDYVITVKYSNKSGDLFYVEIDTDFPVYGTDYDYFINLSGTSIVTIGNNVSDEIRIDDSIILNHYVKLEPQGEGCNLYFNDYKYIRVNGIKMNTDKAYINENEFFSICGYSFCYEDKKLYTSQNNNIITNLQYGIITNSNNHMPYPQYIRNVRQKYQVENEDIEVLPPKEKDNTEEKNILLSLMPLLLNMIVMIAIRGSMGGGKLFIVYCGVTMMVSGGVSIFSILKENKNKRVGEENRKKLYYAYVTEKENYIIDSRNEEKIYCNYMNPTVLQSVMYAEEFDNRLFERYRNQDDFLSIRIGSGIVESKKQIKYKMEEYIETNDDLKDYPQVLHEKYKYLNDMPILLSLKEVNAIGCIGTRKKMYQFLKNMIIQFATSHFYNEIKMYLVIDSGDVELFKWTRWFHNFSNEKTNHRNYMYDTESSKTTLDFLYSEMSRRHETSGQYDVEYIVFVYDSKTICKHPVSKYFHDCASYGFHFVFFEEYEELLHFECQKRIFLHETKYSGYIQDTENGKSITEFEYEHISTKQATDVALKLGCVYVDEINLENKLKKNISLYELLNITSAYDMDLEKNWGESDITKSMSAPIGINSSSEIVNLDVHEKYHGPHGLVAGTTGSGKSEIIQTYILSMALKFHPYEVGFVIIDFKGGGMSNQFNQLPHMLGAITNVNNNDIERSLKSIKAELIKRQRKFAEYGINHIDDYILLYKQGKSDIPLPHIILIVDEFAELKSEYPEFMKELISASRIGRSLGIHLILATQKPAGVVNEQIWSNSKFKLCLKVQTQSDSNEVIKSPLAAEIVEPGRAYLQVGNNEIFTLFQSAYSGASSKINDVNESKEYSICSLDLSGKRQKIYEKKKNNIVVETQLQAVINYIKKYCDLHNISKLNSICLPVLSNCIQFSIDEYVNESSNICIPVGIVDDPSDQKQYVEVFDLSENNVYIQGSTHKGKTNILQSVIRGIASLYSPADVNIFILDFSSRILKNFNGLPHVSGVILESEDDKLKSFIKMIKDYINDRKQLLASMGLSSFTSFRESGKCDIPQLVILIDNYISFKNSYPEYENDMLEIMRESVSVGISFIITNGQTGGVGYKLLSLFSKRTSLYCNDISDYMFLFDGGRAQIENINGRALVEHGNELLECQYYLAFSAEKEYEKLDEIRKFIEEVNSIYSEYKVLSIPEMPEKVDSGFLQMNFLDNTVSRKFIPIGVDYDDLEVKKISLSEDSIIGISGQKTMQNTFLKAIINHLMSREFEIILFDNNTLNEYKELVTEYYTEAENINDAFNIVEKNANSRECNIVIIINSISILEHISQDKELLECFDGILSHFTNSDGLFVISDVPNENITFSSCRILKTLKANKKFIFFENIKNIRNAEINPSIIRKYKKELNEYDGYLCIDGNINKIKTIC